MQGPGPPTFPARRADLWGCRAARRFRCLAARCGPRRVRAEPVASVVPDVRVARPVSAVQDAQVALAVSAVQDAQLALAVSAVQGAQLALAVWAASVVRDVQVVLVALEVQDALAAPAALVVRDVQVVRAVWEAWAEREGPAGPPATQRAAGGGQRAASAQRPSGAFGDMGSGRQAGQFGQRGAQSRSASQRSFSGGGS